jgi:hypothetical protein
MSPFFNLVHYKNSQRVLSQCAKYSAYSPNGLNATESFPNKQTRNHATFPLKGRYSSRKSMLFKTNFLCIKVEFIQDCLSFFVSP